MIFNLRFIKKIKIDYVLSQKDIDSSDPLLMYEGEFLSSQNEGLANTEPHPRLIS